MTHPNGTRLTDEEIDRLEGPHLTNDADMIEHLQKCEVDGCMACDNLMEFFQTCDRCHCWCHNSTVIVVFERGLQRGVCHSCAGHFSS